MTSLRTPPQNALAVRVFVPDTLTSANLWSVSSISIPLAATTQAVNLALANYELVFYGP
jgi:hypothetical protein